MKRTLAVVAFAVVGLMTAGSAIAQLERQSQRTTHMQEHVQPDARQPAQSVRPMYQRRDTWYEFLLKQFNPDNFDYGAWMEKHRQAFLDASVRNPYFKYSSGVTIALLLMTVVCAKQWIDHRRAMWVTAEMMADLYNHDLYSREVAEKAIQKYNRHIERCNRAIEVGEHGTLMQGADVEGESLKTKLEQVAGERDRYLRERDAAQTELETNRRTLANLSVRLDGMSKKAGINGEATRVALSMSDAHVVKHINNLQEQLYAERQTNKRLKGA